MDAGDRLEIPLSKRKVLLIVSASCGFVALGVFLVSLDASTIRAQPRFNDPWLVYAIGIASMVFFGAAGLYAVKRWFDPTPGLVLDQEGLVDHSSGLGAGRIPWTDIRGTRVVEIHKQRLLILDVQDAARYRERGGWFARSLRAMNERAYGSPVIISTNALDIDLGKLTSLIEARMAGHRKPNAYLASSGP